MYFIFSMSDAFAHILNYFYSFIMYLCVVSFVYTNRCIRVLQNCFVDCKFLQNIHTKNALNMLVHASSNGGTYRFQSQLCWISCLAALRLLGGGLVYEAKFCFSGDFNSPVINSCIHLQVIDFYLNKLGLLWHEWAGRWSQNWAQSLPWEI